MPDTAQQQVPTPIEFTLDDGTVVKAPSIEEAFKTVAKMKADTAAELKRAREQYEQAQTQMNALAMQFQQQQQQTRQKEGGFDQQQYYKLLNEDPLSAANYLDAHRFGLQSPEQVPQYFSSMNETVNTLRQEAIGAAFLQQHAEDWPADPAAAKALANRAEQLSRQGHPFTLDTLNLAYGQLVDEGQVTPLEVQNDGGQQQQQEEPNPSLQGGGGDVPASELQKAENMSDADLEAFLRSKGILK